VCQICLQKEKWSLLLIWYLVQVQYIWHRIECQQQSLWCLCGCGGGGGGEMKQAGGGGGGKKQGQATAGGGGGSGKAKGNDIVFSLF
jgi:hypothetical protein